MGSRVDTRAKAFELTGIVTSQLLSGKHSVKREDIIFALNRLSQETSDWAERAGCVKAVKMMREG